MTIPPFCANTETVQALFDWTIQYFELESFYSSQSIEENVDGLKKDTFRPRRYKDILPAISFIVDVDGL